MSATVGILAYGSLISDPGAEIASVRTDTIMDIRTPFNVEFARSSTGRGGAPTLVPVENHGAQVTGQLFVVDLSEDEAADVLYRREINKVGTERRYDPPETPTENTVQVKRLNNFADVDVVFYTDIAANIMPLTPARLAQLAVESVAKANFGRDGISYLIAARNNGIRTALSDEYEAEILRQSGGGNLDEALHILSA